MVLYSTVELTKLDLITFWKKPQIATAELPPSHNPQSAPRLGISPFTSAVLLYIGKEEAEASS